MSTFHTTGLLSKKRSKAKGRGILDGLCVEKTVLTVTLPSLDDLGEEEVNISNFECVGSYNWLDTALPSIIVPGSPRIWREPQPSVPFTVDHDTGFHVCDHNGHRLPDTPLLPIMLAVKSSFDWTGIDYIMDRNSLRKLLSWVKGLKEEFRLDCELIGNTVLCSRWEERAQMAANRQSFGLGLTEKLTSLAPGCEGSAEGNHRIVRYTMGGLKLVVRFEVDGCIPSDRPASDTSFVPAEPPPDTRVTVTRAGSLATDASIIEISSKKRGVSTSWRKRYEQMFFAQTPIVILGTHENGTFTAVAKKTMTELAYVHDNMQPQLRQLCRAMKDIKGLMKSMMEAGKSAKVSLVREGQGLRVYEMPVGVPTLPEEYRDRFTV